MVLKYYIVFNNRVYLVGTYVSNKIYIITRLTVYTIIFLKPTARMRL